MEATSTPREHASDNAEIAKEDEKATSIPIHLEHASVNAETSTSTSSTPNHPKEATAETIPTAEIVATSADSADYPVDMAGPSTSNDMIDKSIEQQPAAPLEATAESAEHAHDNHDGVIPQPPETHEDQMGEPALPPPPLPPPFEVPATSATATDPQASTANAAYTSVTTSDTLGQVGALFEPPVPFAANHSVPFSSFVAMPPLMQDAGEKRLADAAFRKYCK